jgi:uracil-DNA glycosylase
LSVLPAQFWDRLQSFGSPDAFNPWNDRDPLDVTLDGALGRRIRLMRHFDRDARYLLIGEAPGYRGCHFSGIPFTCEKQLCDGIIPGLSAHSRFTTRDLPWSEGSATVIWSTLYDLDIAEQTVCWNAFAFHPHLDRLPLSNRTPTPRELVANADILAMVIQAFPRAKRVAVGKAAVRTLQSLGVDSSEVRHPSMGGARQFREQMRDLIAPAVAA